jgi:uncharacterized protein (DUF2336 family)
MVDTPQGQNPSFTLSAADVEKLIKSPFEAKMEITKKISDYYKNGGFNIEQMRMAEDIFRELVNDTEVQLRKTLAEAIKDAPDMPSDVILDLARDLQEVSLPVLQFSDVLTDADLIEIVTTSGDAAKQKAIATRENVTSSVSDALVNTHDEAVVDSLLHNKGAEVSVSSYSQIVKDFADKEEIMGAVIERDKLPTSVVEHLSMAVSDALCKKLESRHKDTFEKLRPIIEKSREVATMKVIGLECSDADFYLFLQGMEEKKIPSAMIPINALCIGNLKLFEISIARKVEAPVANIRTLIRDTSNTGLKAIYKRAGLPDDFYEAVAMLTSTLRELEGLLRGKGIHICRQSAEMIIRRIKEKIAAGIPEPKNMEYLIALIQHHMYDPGKRR